MTLHLDGISFVAVPKTATIAIERAFAPFVRDFVPHRHENVSSVKSVSQNPCLCLVRHPLEWMESYYKYLRFSPYFAKVDSVWGLRSKSFEDFVQAFMRGRRMWPEPHRFQHEYVCAEGLLVEHVYRYDQLDVAIDHLSTHCCERPAIGMHNVSPEVALELSSGTRAQFEIYMEKDYDLFENTKRP